MAEIMSMLRLYCRFGYRVRGKLVLKYLGMDASYWLLWKLLL
jgi:hypothetical protein